MNVIRVFIAITLDDEIRAELGRIQEALKGLKARVSWVRPEGMHLTLKFLGDTEETRLPEIYGAASRAVCKREPFLLSLGNLGVFPDLAAPRVIWVGIGEGREETKSLARDLETELFKVGYPKERREFSPHLSLGRVKRVVDRGEFNQLPITNYQPKEMVVAKIEVIRSELHPDGAVYSILKEFRLTG